MLNLGSGKHNPNPRISQSSNRLGSYVLRVSIVWPVFAGGIFPEICAHRFNDATYHVIT